jgi:hypothetical protein
MTVTEPFDNIDDALEQQREEQERADAAARARNWQRTIDLGFMAQQFIDSELGRIMEADARAERIKLTEQHVLLDPDNPEDLKQMRDIRFRVSVLNCWQEFLKSYVQNGQAAQTQYQESGQTD